LAKEAAGLEEMVWRIVEAERASRPRLVVPAKGLKILVEAVKLAEEFKPSQHAKRVVFSRHGILGSGLDRLLTSIFYDVLKKQGLLDRVIGELTGAESALILDPWLRAALRVAVDIVLFYRPDVIRCGGFAGALLTTYPPRRIPMSVCITGSSLTECSPIGRGQGA